MSFANARRSRDYCSAPGAIIIIIIISPRLISPRLIARDGLVTVASALNADDQCLARIAAVHLKIPDLPDADARHALEVEDALIQLTREQRHTDRQTSEFAKQVRTIQASRLAERNSGRKRGPIPPQDRHRNRAETKARLIRITARRGLRIVALKFLRLIPRPPPILFPSLDVAADAATALDIADAVSQFWNLAKDVTAVVDFANQGPHALATFRSRRTATRSLQTTEISSKAIQPWTF